MTNPLRTIATEDDGDRVWCPIRIGFIIAFAFMHVMVAVAVIVKGQPFDPIAYGTAVAAMLGGVGAGIFFNGQSEAPRGQQ
jgi:hypothetical protein